MIEMRADHDITNCKYGYNIPIINIKSNTKMPGRRKQTMPQATRPGPGVQIADCYDEVQIYQIRLPYATSNCSHTPRQAPTNSVDATQRKRERVHLKRSKRHKLALDTPRFDTSELNLSDLTDMRGVEEECMKKEERKKSIRDKLERGQEYLFTKLEERDIHERAEIYSMCVSPDEDYYIPPEEQKNDSMIGSKSSYGHHRSYQVPKKRKRRNYMSDTVFLTYHNHSDPYDNSHKLPIGSKLIRPPDKLVELVAQAIDGSHDGLLQVPQIYTVVQNRYPYFRYMDRAAVGSWRSSIRHALYQKWFRKVRFGTHAINTKGCYWANNHTYVPVNRREETILRRHKPITDHDHSGKKETQGSEKNYFDDFDLDPDTHDKVIALLTEEEEKEKDKGMEFDLQGEFGNLEDVMVIANEYGISLEEYSPMFGMDKARTTVRVGSETVPSPVPDPDPILSTCVPDWQTDTEDHMIASSGTTRAVNSKAVFPASDLTWTEQQQAVYNISCPPPRSTGAHQPLTSPANANPEMLRLDYRFDNSGSLLSDPQMGIGPASQSSEGCQFFREPYDTEASMSFDIEQLPEMYNSDMFMPEINFSELS